ncbi:MAG: hypothetical protein HW380_2890 [Magnetococcales bacterium]|nr:hypothetical protein [Magnetococcales bacterium]
MEAVMGCHWSGLTPWGMVGGGDGDEMAVAFRLLLVR